MENHNPVRSTQRGATITEAEAGRRLAACYRLLLSLQPREQDGTKGTDQVDAAQAALEGTSSHK